MAVAGSLTYDTKIDKTGFKDGLNKIEKETSNAGTKIKDIVAGLGITQIIGKAFNLITSNIDTAVKRIDTLNNFPKVMNNLGISSEDSTKAVTKLSEGLKGIPTKLDDASLAVQRFTSINNDVNKSTDYFLAFNNALLAGGASAEIQSNALEQLSQMYGVGAVDAEAWKSVQTAIPAQLQQVAKSMGYTSTAVSGDFYNAIKSGKISMEDFMQQIVKLNKEGTGQYASFAEQAKSATGGIQTSISNAKTAVSRGVANIIKSVDDGLKNAKLGSISDIISEIGKKIESVLKGISNKIPEVIKWISKNKESLIMLGKVILTVISAYKAYQVALLAIQKVQIAQSVIKTTGAFISLIPQVKTAKEAMGLFNMVTKANPVGILVTAITALCAGLTVLAIKQFSATKESKDFATQMANSKKEMEDYRNKIDQNTYANLSHIESAKNLRQELSELVDENGKVKEGYKGRVSFILNELNSALGTEYKLNGDVVDSYKDLQKEIDTTIEKKKAQIILQGEEEKYKDAIENEKQAVEDLKEAHEKLGMSYETAKQRVEDYKNAKEKLYGSRQGEELTGGEHDAFWNYSSKEIKSLENLVKGYEDAENKVKTYVGTINKYSDLYAKYTQNKYDEIANTVTATTEDWTAKTLDELQSSITEQSKALNTYKDIYNRTQDELALQTAQQAQQNLDSLAGELEKRTKTIGDLGQSEIDAWKNLAEQSYSSYSVELSKMSPEMQQKIQDATGIIAAGTPQMQAKAGELGDKMIQEFDRSADAKQKALDIISAYLKGLDDDTKKQLLKQAGIEDVDTVLNELNKGNVSEENGKNILAGLWRGLKNGSWQNKILSAASGLAQSVNKSFTGRNGWDEHSPSKKMKKYAEYYIQPISDTINKKKKDIIGSAQNLVSSMNDRIMAEMKKAVAIETRSINATASIKSNNSMLSVIQANMNIDGSVNIDGRKVGRILAPEVCRTIKVGGLT